MRSFVLALTAAPAALAASITTAAAYASSSDGVYKLSEYAAPVKGTGNPGSNSTWSLKIDDSASGHKQTIRGFGAAVTDATVAVFNDLPSATLSQLLNELMTSDGANFAMLRHTVASSDLSADPAYSYDDNNGNVDTSLSSFNLGDRGTAMAELLAKMQALQPDLTLLGSVWSPPGWMKLNGVIDGTTVNNNLNHNYVDEYAQYFVKYIQAYAKLGSTVNAITIQNEPLNSQAGMPTMYVYADESGLLIQQNVGPALANADLNVKIWAYDHNTGMSAVQFAPSLSSIPC
jgi:glucan endo-1,6-beta-glucosidase